MKNICKKVFALSLSLFLAMSASAQLSAFHNDAAQRDKAEALAAAAQGQHLTMNAAKAARVTVTVDTVTATTVDLSFDMNDSTTHYAVIFDFEGSMNIMLNWMGYPLEEALQLMCNSNMVYAYAYGDTTLTGISGFVPGSTNPVYVYAWENATTTAGYAFEFTMATQGGNGTAAMELAIDAVTDSSFTYTATMNDQTNIYYLAIVESGQFAGLSEEEIVNQLMYGGIPAMWADTTEMIAPLYPSVSYTVYAVPVNAAGEIGALAQASCTTLPQGDNGTAAVTLRVDSITTTSFYVEVQMNASTNLYYFTFDDISAFEGLSTAEIEEMVLSMGSRFRYCTDVAGSVDGNIPGSTLVLYIFPYNANLELGTPVVDTISILPQGGTGTAEVNLIVSNITDNSFELETTMNDQTNIYYLNLYDSTEVAGCTIEMMEDSVRAATTPYYMTMRAQAMELDECTTYQTYIFPYNANNELGAYKIINTRTTGCVSIEEANGIRYSIYPNPATSLLNVSGEAIDRVELYNVLGQRVMESDLNGTAAHMDVNNLPKGAYLLKLYSNTETATQKVIIK